MARRVALPPLSRECSGAEKIQALQVEFSTLRWAVGRTRKEMLARMEEIASALEHHNAEVG